jgi:prepilin-type N-terminal cleavage/methylation domain-containing protein
MRTRCPKRTAPALPLQGFTLIELLVVIAIIAILAALLIPVLNSAKQKSYAATCISGNKQLMLAWELYTEDNDDYVVDLDIQNPGHDNNETSWMVIPVPLSGAATTQDQALAGADYSWTHGSFNKYAPNPELQHCPADPRYRFSVPNDPRGAWAYESYSGVGGANGGGWENQSSTPGSLATSVGGQPCWTIWKKAELQAPSQQYIFLEEFDYRMGYNEGGWGLQEPACPLTGVGGGNWWDVVACCAHIDSSVLSYGDGHAEKHRWVNILGTKAADGYPYSLANNSADIQYMNMWMPCNWDAVKAHNGCQ